MKTILTILILAFATGCKKAPVIIPKVIEATPVVLKLGDMVRWQSANNPHPNNQMRIVALYYDADKKPLTATVIDGSIYYTMSVVELILWK